MAGAVWSMVGSNERTIRLQAAILTGQLLSPPLAARDVRALTVEALAALPARMQRVLEASGSVRPAPRSSALVCKPSAERPFSTRELLGGVGALVGCSLGGEASTAQRAVAVMGVGLVYEAAVAAAGAGGMEGEEGEESPRALSAADVHALGAAERVAQATRIATLLREEGVVREERTVGGRLRAAGPWTSKELLCGLLSWGGASAGGQFATVQRSAAADGVLLLRERAAAAGGGGGGAAGAAGADAAPPADAASVHGLGAAARKALAKRIATLLEAEGVKREARPVGGVVRAAGPWQWEEVLCGLLSWGGAGAGSAAGGVFAGLQNNAAADGLLLLNTRRIAAAAAGGGGGGGGAPTPPAYTAAIYDHDGAEERMAVAQEIADLLREEGVERVARAVGGQHKPAGAWEAVEILRGLASWAPGARSAEGAQAVNELGDFGAAP